MLPNWFEEVCYHSFLFCHIHMNMVELDMTKRSGSSCGSHVDWLHRNLEILDLDLRN